MRLIPIMTVLLLYPAMVLAAAPIQTTSMPTLGEGALLALMVGLPAAGVWSLRRRLRSKR